VVRDHRIRQHPHLQSSAPSLKATSMHLTSWLVGGLFGLTGFYTFAGFVRHLFAGNPDMALMYFVALGVSVAMGWMFMLCWRQANSKRAMGDQQNS
jgi:hypothetical protein